MYYRNTHLALLFIVGFIGCDRGNDEVLAADTVSNCETNSSLYDYCLNDINHSSSTYGSNISPSYYNNKVTVHYFGHQN